MSYPTLWGLRNLVAHVNDGDTQIFLNDEVGYVPARPAGYPSLRERFKIAWLVFTGQADAVIWPHQ